LDLLPDVSIAEEARDSGATAIFDIIITSGTRYALMHDYEQTVNDEIHPKEACLNGDTAVRSMLNVKQKFQRDSILPAYQDRWPDVTEDMSIDEYDSEPLKQKEALMLLYSPLLVDLSTVRKDLLILMATYYGDLDRCLRLRRPTAMHMRGEIECVRDKLQSYRCARP